MYSHNNESDLVEQPLMSTGTPEPGFEAHNNNSEKNTVLPKIGNTVVGERKDK